MPTKQQHKEQFISSAMTIHNSRYDYSDINYVNSHTPVNIGCSVHGTFMQRPRTHLDGSGCPCCASIKRQITWDDIVNQSTSVHNNKYQYTQIESPCKYSGWMQVRCATHGNFKQRVSTHLSGAGCKQCSAEAKCLTLNDFIKRAMKTHGDTYDYTHTKYTTIHSKVSVNCYAHGEFVVSPSMHIQRTGCPKCRSSAMNRLTRQWLASKNITFFEEHRFDDCRSIYPLPFDFFCPDVNIAIECDGQQHFVPVNFCGNQDKALERFKLTQKHDRIKSNYCKDHNISLIRIRFDENIEDVLKTTLNI